MAMWMVCLASLVIACKQPDCPPAPVPAPAPVAAPVVAPASVYLDSHGRPDLLSGGARKIDVKTPAGTFKVWAKRTGNNPRIKVLIITGGPGLSHDYFEVADSFFPQAEVEYYYYEALDTGHSDHPGKPELWTIARYTDEVEQVRQALGLDASNFFLLGHSWGGIIATEYAIAHGDKLKGVIISNMMASVPAYNEYARVLMKQMDPKVLAEILQLEKSKQTEKPRYMELLGPHYYEEHVVRFKFADLPEPITREPPNRKLYVTMQGPSEMGASGRIENWDRFADLSKITVPTLIVGATHDTMDPAYMETMAKQVKRGRFLLCPNGSHMSIYYDPDTFWPGVITFLRDVDGGRF